MQPATPGTVYIVDDDASVRDALAWLLRSRHLYSEVFDSAEACLQRLAPPGAAHPAVSSCLLLDVRMPGLSGLALFDALVARGLTAAMPVIFLTGHADVPTAVDAVKRGAFDFCEKPFSDNALVDRIEQALAQSAQVLAARRETDSLQQRLAALTGRERDVMRRVADGLPNKLIADQLDISVRTVEVHRARVFEKLNVKSAVELVNMLRNS
ncbi:MAG: LuxR C-terminal-related transcriptional regulator [Burkholderiales bacterium]|nr:LuxR C-terminal-related transcriptional regulator [Burkholderiales bacterium]